jgi:hypothetical protein
MLAEIDQSDLVVELDSQSFTRVRTGSLSLTATATTRWLRLTINPSESLHAGSLRQVRDLTTLHRRGQRRDLRGEKWTSSVLMSRLPSATR